MCPPYVVVSPAVSSPSERRNGKTSSPMSRCMAAVSPEAFMRDQRRCSFAGGNGIGLLVEPSRRSSRSAVVCCSSSRRRNSRYVTCSITSSGFEMPPDQNVSHTRSMRLFSSPVITTLSLCGSPDGRGPPCSVLACGQQPGLPRAEGADRGLGLRPRAHRARENPREPVGSDRRHGDEVIEAREIRCIAREHSSVVGGGRGSDHEVDRSSAHFTSVAQDETAEGAVRVRRRIVEGEPVAQQGSQASDAGLPARPLELSSRRADAVLELCPRQAGHGHVVPGMSEVAGDEEVRVEDCLHPALPQGSEASSAARSASISRAQSSSVPSVRRRAPTSSLGTQRGSLRGTTAATDSPWSVIVYVAPALTSRSIRVGFCLS